MTHHSRFIGVRFFSVFRVFDGVEDVLRERRGAVDELLRERRAPRGTWLRVRSVLGVACAKSDLALQATWLREQRD